MADTRARCPACLKEEQVLREAIAAEEAAKTRVSGVQARRNALVAEASAMKSSAESLRNRIDELKPVLSSTYDSLEASAQETGLAGESARTQVSGSVAQYQEEREKLSRDAQPLATRLRSFKDSLATIDAEVQAAQEELQSAQEEVSEAEEALSSCNASKCGSEGRESKSASTTTTFSVQLPAEATAEEPDESGTEHQTDG